MDETLAARRTSSLCFYVTGLMSVLLCSGTRCGKHRFLRIVRWVGRRTQLETNECIVWRTCKIHPQSTMPTRTTLVRGGQNQPGSVPRADSAQGMEPRASTHSTMCLSFRPEQFAVTTCARKWAVFLTS